MTGLERQMFRHYIYGKVNEYFMFKEYRMPVGVLYRDFKMDMTFSHLGLPEKNRETLMFLIRMATRFEVTIALFIIVLRFVKSFCRTLFLPNKTLYNKEIILGIPAQKVNTLFKQARVDTKNVCVVRLPYSKNTLYDNNWGEKISIYSVLTCKDVWRSFILACRMSFFLKIKYGYRDCMFRAYSAFEYFMCYFFFNKIDASNEVFFTSINDRWVYLFGNLTNRTIFLQHGALNKNKVLFIMSNVGKADVAYYINTIQRDICNRYMFCNVPEERYFTQMEFTSNEKLIHNGKKHILLVCENIYFEKEKIIIQDVSSTEKYNLYVKPHPQNNPDKYIDLQRRYGFVLLGKTDYPEVDYLISYDSTLVHEYFARGVKTLMYEDTDFYEEYKKLLA